MQLRAIRHAREFATSPPRQLGRKRRPRGFGARGLRGGGPRRLDQRRTAIGRTFSEGLTGPTFRKLALPRPVAEGDQRNNATKQQKGANSVKSAATCVAE